jgi:hypothetical protein
LLAGGFDTTTGAGVGALKTADGVGANVWTVTGATLGLSTGAGVLDGAGELALAGAGGGVLTAPDCAAAARALSLDFTT